MRGREPIPENKVSAKNERIDIKHIDSLCKAFNCEVSELFEYIPTPEDKDKDKN